jgi:phage/plasmid-associated DNA primase
MTALRRIKKMGDIYINEKTIEEKRVKYQRAHNPVKAFFEEAVDEESTEENYVSKMDFHIVYVIYCRRYGLPTEKYDAFCKLVKKNRSEHINGGSQIREARKYLGDRNADGKTKFTHCWAAIKLAKEYAEFLLRVKGGGQTTL